MSVEIHHLAAVSSDLQRTIRFYHNMLGLKFMLKSSLFDGPKVCYFYWDKEIKNFITFYHCPDLRKWKAGINTIVTISFSVAKDGIGFWKKRLKLFGIRFRVTVDEIEDTVAFVFYDAEGLQLKFVFANTDNRMGTCNGTFRSLYAIKGLFGVEIVAMVGTGLKALFTEQLKMAAQPMSENDWRYSGAQKAGNIIDLRMAPGTGMDTNRSGMIHHMALKVRNWNHFMALYYHLKHRNKSTIFRNHPNNYSAFYFREEGNILLEIVGQRIMICDRIFHSEFQVPFFLKKAENDIIISPTAE
jgi:catechol 2,3-dioxygenase-like lactoylglutathione lyase family enzyme